jgi:hypothetical protein
MKGVTSKQPSHAAAASREEDRRTPPTLADADVPFIHLEFIWHHANGT